MTKIERITAWQTRMEKKVKRRLRRLYNKHFREDAVYGGKNPILRPKKVD